MKIATISHILSVSTLFTGVLSFPVGSNSTSTDTEFGVYDDAYSGTAPSGSGSTPPDFDSDVGFDHPPVYGLPEWYRYTPPSGPYSWKRSADANPDAYYTPPGAHHGYYGFDPTLSPYHAWKRSADANPDAYYVPPGAHHGYYGFDPTLSPYHAWKRSADASPEAYYVPPGARHGYYGFDPTLSPYHAWKRSADASPEAYYVPPGAHHGYYGFDPTLSPYHAWKRSDDSEKEDSSTQA